MGSGQASDDDTLPLAGGRSDDAGQASIRLERGAPLGRFLILEVLGQGGMGIVVGAYDPHLDRRVAIKVLKPGGGGGPATARLLREAKSMARLSHPNVITVHEVGVWNDQVFVAMEYVEGETLGRWMRAESRPWREVLLKFCAAGRGLAAAHRAGIVHRDFKPENVLVGSDGRVCVTDFGLASTAGARVERPSALQLRPRDLVDPSILSQTLTREGAVLGTPAYMSPEQHDMNDITEKADQFSFCVALYEALYGQRPFAGANIVELMENVREGRVRAAPQGAAVPAWVRDVVLRGLAVAPDARHPSTDMLIDALGRDPGLQRRRVVRTGAAAAGLVALTSAIVLAVVQPSSSPVTCGQGAARLADVWGAGPAERVRHALVATGVPHAPATAQRVTAAFDEYAAAWTDMHRAACEATHVRGEQSEALLDLRMACLERRRGELGALVSLLINDSDAALVDRAAVAARSLPSIADCADTDRLKETIPLPGEPAVRRRIEEAEARLDEVKALHRTGRYAEGEKAVVALMGPAVATDHPPLVADAFYMRAVLARENADTGAALAAFRQSILAAARARDHRRVAQGWVDLLYTLADKAARLEEAAHLEPAVEAAVRQAGSPPELEGLWLRALGTLRKEQGRFDEAVALLERAIAAEERSDAPSAMRLGGYHTSLGISLARTGRYAEASEHMSKSRQHLEEVLGAEHPRLLAAGHHLGGLYLQQSRYREARDLLEEVRDGRVRALGPDHPDLAKTLNNLALAYKELGEYERAAETHREALRIKSARLGPEHPSVATSWNNLGLIAKRLGRNAEAREALERALAIREQQLGKDHVMVGSTLRNLGQLDLVEARYNDARRRLERALAIQRKALGERHADVGHVLANLGELDHRTGRPGGGRRYFERAVAIFDESVGADSAPAAIVRGQLARALLGQGRALEAVTLAEAAVKAYESTPADPAELAGLRFILARCLRAAGRGGESARALALQAREGADPESELARDIDAWLADLSAR